MMAFDDSEVMLVCDKMCDQCLYSDKAIVDDQRKAEIQGDQDPSHWFICHKATIKGKKVMCRGYYEANKNTSDFIKAAELLGRISFMNVERGSRTITMFEKKKHMAAMDRATQLRDILNNMK